MAHPTYPHPHFCLCAVTDEQSLKNEMERLRDHGIQICPWYEPDKENELTAFATAPISGDLRKHCRKLKLLKSPDLERVANV
jgi:hypothetical protein